VTRCVCQWAEMDRLRWAMRHALEALQKLRSTTTLVAAFDASARPQQLIGLSHGPSLLDPYRRACSKAKGEVCGRSRESQIPSTESRHAQPTGAVISRRQQRRPTGGSVPIAVAELIKRWPAVFVLLISLETSRHGIIQRADKGTTATSGATNRTRPSPDFGRFVSICPCGECRATRQEEERRGEVTAAGRSAARLNHHPLRSRTQSDPNRHLRTTITVRWIALETLTAILMTRRGIVGRGRAMCRGLGLPTC
jgi:hypothetical protein